MCYKFIVIYLFVIVINNSVAEESPPTIVVNNVILPTTQISHKDQEIIIHFAEYQFLDGDTVFVSCINPDLKKCASITMNYAFFGTKDDHFKTEDVHSEKGVGFRSKLRSEHDNSRMLCTCTNEKYNTTAQVVFKLNNHYDHKINLTINGLAMRSFENTSDANQVYRFEYLYKESDIVNVVCATNAESTWLSKHGECGVPGYTKTNRDGNEIIYTKPNTSTSCNYICKLRNKYQSNGREESIDVNFKRLPTFNVPIQVAGPQDLTVNLTQDNNILLEMYEHEKRKLIYYEFDEGDVVTLVASMREEDTEQKVIVHNSINAYYFVASAKSVFSPKDDNTIHEFVLDQYESSPNGNKLLNKSLESISVIFRKKRPKIINSKYDETTIKEDDKIDKNIMLAGGGILLCVVLITVFIVIYKNKKKNTQRNSGAYQNFRCESDTIPAFPPQWSPVEEINYAVPADQKTSSDIYSEPVMPDTYAVPIPKNLRPKPSNCDPAYASIEFAKQPFNNYANDRSQYAAIGEMYSQVLPKSARQKPQNPYETVDAKYENNVRPEYVEPAYCELDSLK